MAQKNKKEETAGQEVGQVATAEAAASEKQPVVFDHDHWIYHATNKPYILKKGNVVPEGWQLTPKFDSFYWSQDDYGKWTRVEKK